MFRSARGIFGLAVGSGLVTAGLYYWWGYLTVGTFAQCVGGNPPAGVDCAHNFQIFAAFGFAILTVLLLLAAIVRALQARYSSRRVA
jgi:hypothetical protein